MDLTQLINHPETMDKETLYDLRNMVALYPYYQTARLLMLKNLYLLHDSSFDEELRRAAIYITNREKLFEMVEAVHYGLAPAEHDTRQPQPASNEKTGGEIEHYRSSTTFSTRYPPIRSPKQNDESQHPPTLPSTMWPFCLIVRPKKKRTRRKKTLRK